ncbi:ubiquitin carboxyl-terminal hydrolase CYLD [Embiotoca jacksoni]|uniref:ubiquitin carboxyl-terminal hydrolase CYLD n=1 Tax=Embiotoca jacksoni TaxID=100190 RepID=UPI00370425A6
MKYTLKTALKMSGAHEQHRKRHPPKVFLLSTALKLQDELEGAISLQRGFICQEQDLSKSKWEFPWVKVLDNGSMLKIARRFLIEVPADFTGLLEAVVDPEARLKLLDNPGNLKHLASLPIDSPLWVQINKPDELAEAELKYIGPLTRGTGPVYFGAELVGSSVGKGQGNGCYKGHRLFTCAEACALFLPVSHVRQRHWVRSQPSDVHERAREHHPGTSHPSSSDRPTHPTPQQQQQHQQRQIGFRQYCPGSPPQPHASGIVPRTAESAPVGAHHQAQGQASPQLFLISQRVCFPLDDVVHAGEVRFCGALPDRSSSGIYVGILLDSPIGNWDGHSKGEKLCHIPSPLYGLLLPVTKVSSEQKSPRPNLPPQIPKSILKVGATASVVAKPFPTSPPTTAARVAMVPPAKQALRPPLPKLGLKPLLPPPPPPPTPRSPTPPPGAEQPLYGEGACDTPWSLKPLDDGAGDTRDAGLEVGSMVEVNDPPLFGVIRWIGRIPGISAPVAGIELDQELCAGTDGSYIGERHFRCPANRGLFVKLRNCRRDSRFPAPETPVNQVERCNSIAFAEWGSERVEEHTPPLVGDEARELYQGWKKGIQGHLNSCYLDASLFSLFSCCSSVDWLLFWPSDPEVDADESLSRAQDLLRCEIVNPLRRFGYVCASKTMALRRLLEGANSNTGFTNQEKDPEEFLNKLFQLLRVDPLLKIRSTTQRPQECHLYQLFPPIPPPSPPSAFSLGDPDLPSPAFSRMRVANVQALLESSFLHAGLKFVESPSCLLLLMPRFGKDFKMFDAILPTLSIDVTDLLDDALRQCSICQAAAEWECLQCYEDPDITPGQLKQFCHICNTQVHKHNKRTSHGPLKISIPQRPWSGPLQCARQRMSLFAVTCIETSHYVSFVKNGPLPSDWLFFDSMADREGGENGFNIPQVKACPEVGRYLSLSEEDLRRVDPASLREPARRLLCDAYMCLYHNPELSLYK